MHDCLVLLSVAPSMEPASELLELTCLRRNHSCESHLKGDLVVGRGSTANNNYLARSMEKRATRKLKCDRNVPCSNCTKSKTGRCVYDVDATRPDVRQQQQPTPSSPGAETPGQGVQANFDLVADTTQALRDDATVFKRSTAPEVNSTRLGHRHTVAASGASSKHGNLQLNDTTTQPSTHLATAVSGTFQFQYASNLSGGSRPTATIHKNRYFGQSHWSNCTPLVGSGNFPKSRHQLTT
nr:hypothetical protein CFP56_69124 [Quercus suber]